MAMPPQETGFSLAEESAIKEMLQGMVVNDQRADGTVVGQREVKVFYRWPISDTEKKYPFVTIDLIDIQHATERESSAQTIYLEPWAPGPGEDPMRYRLDHPARLPYWPDTTSDVSDLPNWNHTLPVASTVELTPVNFVFRIASHAREPRHDRQITAQLLGRNRIPFRYGELFVDADNTVRRVFNLGWQQADYSDNETAGRKMIYRKVIMLSVNGEMGYAQLQALGLAETLVVNIDPVE